jgi:hypothetical protein
MPKLSKTFESADCKQSLDFTFDYETQTEDVLNLTVSVLDTKTGILMDLTDLFYSNKELWAIADEIIDNTIKLH